MISRPMLFLALAGFLAINLGCSGGGTDEPELGLVTGTVKFDGTPLTGATVSFIPNDGRPASGQTDESGTYQLTYIRDTPGCKVGLCSVEIAFGEESAEDEALDGDDLVQNPTKPIVRIPPRYNTNSELEADVKPGVNTFDFDLASK